VSRPDADIIELVAANPDGDLACDYTIATQERRRDVLATLTSLVREVRRLDAGVEATFPPESYEAVRRYIDLESRCCSFLTLVLAREPDAVILRVTGRAEAVPLIEDLFGIGGRPRPD
jgi:hypothetical protein